MVLTVRLSETNLKPTSYARIKGMGTFKLTTVSDRVMWDLLEWD